MMSYLISDMIVLNSDNLLDNCSTLDNMMCFGLSAPVDSTVKSFSSSFSVSVNVTTFAEFHRACSVPLPNLAYASNFID